MAEKRIYSLACGYTVIIEYTQEYTIIATVHAPFRVAGIKNELVVELEWPRGPEICPEIINCYIVTGSERIYVENNIYITSLLVGLDQSPELKDAGLNFV